MDKDDFGEHERRERMKEQYGELIVVDNGLCRDCLKRLTSQNLPAIVAAAREAANNAPYTDPVS